jgi:neutral ceramidase
VIRDVVIVGVPAEYSTSLAVDIKKRSPFRHTYIASLCNDWIAYLPDREGHRLGGYQTWTGLHSYAEAGTGERVADEAVRILNELTTITGTGSSAAPRLSRPESQDQRPDGG